ncbi:MAG: hypothetical protein CMJ47_11220 [Planctomyces sp.]|nr:hypothetical protein [Planctomyces sp.]
MQRGENPEAEGVSPAKSSAIQAAFPDRLPAVEILISPIGCAALQRLDIPGDILDRSAFS